MPGLFPSQTSWITHLWCFLVISGKSCGRNSRVVDSLGQINTHLTSQYIFRWFHSANFFSCFFIYGYWWQVSFGSGSALGSSDNMPLPEPMFTQIFITRPQRVKSLYSLRYFEMKCLPVCLFSRTLYTHKNFCEVFQIKRISDYAEANYNAVCKHTKRLQITRKW